MNMGLLIGKPGLIWRPTRHVLVASCVGVMLGAPVRSFAQPSEPQCRPVSQRTSELGCWIIVDDQVGLLPAGQMFWHLDTYPIRTAAEDAKQSRGTVVEALGKIWLFTIAEATWRPRSGVRIAEIGPLPVQPGSAYSAMYMEAVFTPGMTSAIHTHSGPEAWYTTAGESCLETPQGAMFGRAGGPPLIVPAGPPMLLTAIGKVQRRAIVLILHNASQSATTLEHDWKPKGLCTVQ
jgi:quercetin dioxygenase-like cupin family protein